MKARECGECGECCFALDVDVDGGSKMTECPHFCGGCTIYEDRPKSCADWNCLWITGDAPKSQRPDRTKIIFWLPDLDTAARWSNRLVMAAETMEAAHRMPSTEKYIRKLQRAGNSVMVIHVDGGRTLYVQREFLARVIVDSKKNGVVPSLSANKITFTAEQADKIWQEQEGGSTA